ncbi:MULTISPECIES: DHH family phosphoesterase [Paenibacillus]|uniref:DHH family phosphoesterase n=1 Tax=Paenibacillus TaxID=44249 RepID=UPI00041964A9|nr:MULTISPECIES: bifunctional oligoribonuclease/PAP phosphatase NrnA [Paenibacillus]KEO76412.1 exopolyphosphatase [Paenibacillus polymyxa]MBP1308418.1 phosphoesterase RecJ-like protein [Paenibacillus sp. 1182]MCH6190133.1 bifunctional oligoribonuclease/PAP phosphatase NrnA [Paenibacillus polymyxa]MDY8093935.1 bifunctional oligoribonuclease/PAP phosphatase NrnA [Paenibacillus polymyxa]UMY56766.1 bifunctional oligoribonuclease/PAP phosphatase NrnA [Paenibacillus peoriae]
MHTYEQALQQAKEFILEHDDYLIVSHVQPDGDAVSSTVTVGWLLSCLGKKFTMLNEGPIPKRMDFLWHADEIMDMSQQPPERKYNRIICVDCADYRRVGLTEQFFTEDAIILNIDHHPTNDAYGTVNVIKSDAAATAEILFDLLEEFAVTWDVEVATAVYTGLLTDTGGFRYSNTSPKVMSTVSQLLTYGVDGPSLSEKLLEEMTFPQMKVLTKALQTLTMSEDGKVAWVVVSPDDMTECGAVNEDLEGIVNYPRNIRGVEVGIFFKVINDQAVKASLRSAGNVDVAALAQSFGGGGHVRAAGCRLEGKLEDIIKTVVGRVKSEL